MSFDSKISCFKKKKHTKTKQKWERERNVYLSQKPSWMGICQLNVDRCVMNFSSLDEINLTSIIYGNGNTCYVHFYAGVWVNAYTPVECDDDSSSKQQKVNFVILHSVARTGCPMAKQVFYHSTKWNNNRRSKKKNRWYRVFFLLSAQGRPAISLRITKMLCYTHAAWDVWFFLLHKLWTGNECVMLFYCWFGDTDSSAGGAGGGGGGDAVHAFNHWHFNNLCVCTRTFFLSVFLHIPYFIAMWIHSQWVNKTKRKKGDCSRQRTNRQKVFNYCIWQYILISK